MQSFECEAQPDLSVWVGSRNDYDNEVNSFAFQNIVLPELSPWPVHPDVSQASFYSVTGNYLANLENFRFIPYPRLSNIGPGLLQWDAALSVYHSLRVGEPVQPEGYRTDQAFRGFSAFAIPEPVQTTGWSMDQFALGLASAQLTVATTWDVISFSSIKKLSLTKRIRQLQESFWSVLRATRRFIHRSVARYCSVSWTRRLWFLLHGAHPPKADVLPALGHAVAI
jgi:hypothetical protein